MTPKLDDFQLAAVRTLSPRVVVPATAGSGKTTTMVARVRFMVEELHYYPRSIVVLTFTRYAANGMRQKLGALGRKLGFIGTIHAWLLGIIKEYGKARKWEGAWLTILDEQEAEIEMDACLREAGLKDRRGAWSGCLASEWDAFVRLTFQGDSSAVPALRVSANTEFGKIAKMRSALQLFVGRMMAENAMTFDMIISEALLLLKQHNDVLQDIRASLKHIVLDEVQDTDSRQWEIVDLLNPTTLFAVGDVDQSIYQWRGANPRKLIELAMSDDVTVLFLPKSYRFGHQIAQYANCLIRNNKDRLAMTIRAAGVSEDVAVMEQLSPQHVYDQIMIDVDKSATKGSDVCVLSRTHSVLQSVADELRRAQVPFEYPGSADDVTATPQHRIVKGILRLMVNRHDKRGFIGVAPALDLPDAKLLDIRQHAVSKGVSLYDACGRTDLLPERVNAVVAKAQELCPRLDWEREREFIEQVQLAEGFTDAQDMLNHFAMSSLQDRLSAKRECLTLCTIHAAKGLEWPVVYLIGMNEGMMPSNRSMKEDREEEERRIAYVGMTRAQKKLKLVHMESEKLPEPSRFLKESGGKFELKG